MTNAVNVVATGINSDLSNIQTGSVLFTPSDTVWVTQGNLLGAVIPVTFTFNGGAANLSVMLFAMDNAGVSTNWTWIMSGNLEGVPIRRRSLVVNFAAGPQQQLATLLDASTLVP